MTYDPDDESPEAKMFREQAAQENKDEAVVEALLASLTPADAQMDLFTAQEIVDWGLKHCRKRAKEPTNNDHEADGA
jgi:hypothetical protein